MKNELLIIFKKRYQDQNIYQPNIGRDSLLTGLLLMLKSDILGFFLIVCFSQ